MGQGHGTLQGAYAPALAPIPPLPSTLVAVTVPPSAGLQAGGVTLTVQAGGGLVNVVIPDGLGPGDTFNVSVPDHTRVICSNLPTVPGHEIVLAKPIIWACEQQLFQGRFDTTPFDVKAGSLLQQAQAQLIQQAIHQGCNAVLGVTFNVAIKKPGRGEGKGVYVTMLGTPCFVAPKEKSMEAIVEGKPIETTNSAQPVPMARPA